MSSRDPGVKVQSHRLADAATSSISPRRSCQGKEIGQVHLGIYQAAADRGGQPGTGMLGILTLVTSAAGAVGVYLLAGRLAAPIGVIRNSLRELAKGRYDYRIADTRKDEFGELYAEFDKTAAALEQLHERLLRAEGRRRGQACGHPCRRRPRRGRLRDAAPGAPPAAEPPPAPR